MDPVVNPYAPGAGQRPPELAGRDADLRAFTVLLDRLEQRRPKRSLVLTGLRGVGKTVLLGEFRRTAEHRGWIIAKVEAGGRRPFRRLVAQALNAALRTASGRHRRDDPRVAGPRVPRSPPPVASTGQGTGPPAERPGARRPVFPTAGLREPTVGPSRVEWAIADRP